MEQAQIRKDPHRRTAEACGVVRKAKTQNELQLEQVTHKKEKIFYNISERRVWEGGVLVPQQGMGT